MDIVWDTYKASSIKDLTKEKRGNGQRRKVTGETKIPPNWKAFLQDNTNKKELFALLTSRVANFQFPENKEVNVTSDEFVVTSRGSSDMQRCNHEEADTRIALHVQHALDKGCKRVFVRTVDTDVLIILIGLFHDMITSCPSAAILVWAWGSTSNTSALIPPARFLDLKHLGHSLSFIHLLFLWQV